MQSGFPEFGSWLGYDSHVLEEMVRILGKPSGSSCNASVGKVKGCGQCSLFDQVGDIGADESFETLSPIRLWMDPPGSTPSSKEVHSLASLLRRTLNYAPEEGLPIEGFLRHRWSIEGFEAALISSTDFITADASTVRIHQ